MAIIGIGVDVVHLPRICSLIRRRTAQRLANRILSVEELFQWRQVAGDDIVSQTRFLAVRWSLKEAAYKALYPTIQMTWKDLTYHGVDLLTGSKPKLSCHIMLVKDSPKLHVSVSHDGDYVFTTVLAESSQLGSSI